MSNSLTSEIPSETSRKLKATFVCAKCHEKGSELPRNPQNSFTLVDEFNVNLTVYMPKQVFYVI